MPLVATQPGAPETGKAFPNAESLDNASNNEENRDAPVNPRDAIFDQMDDLLEEQRTAELAEAGEIPKGIRDDGLDEPPVEDLEGLASREQMHEPENPDTGLPADLKNDPFADYIVMDGDNAMFKTKVDGQEQLIPLDTARAQLQKHVAAEVRLQAVAADRKSLEEREEALRQNEALFDSKRQVAEQSPPPVDPDVSDQAIREEANEVVKSLFSGTEDQAAESLATLLRNSRQAQGPQVNAGEIANQAVAAARQQLQNERAVEDAETKKKDIDAGFKQFGDDYPDIVGDINLFRYADGLTDTIAAEHPDWAPSAVMAEAGKQTTEWVKSFGTASEAGQQPNDRHNRKRNLTRMPRNRAGVQPAGQEELVDTPQSMMDEIRSARGQGG